MATLRASAYEFLSSVSATLRWLVRRTISAVVRARTLRMISSYVSMEPYLFDAALPFLPFGESSRQDPDASFGSRPVAIVPPSYPATTS